MADPLYKTTRTGAELDSAIVRINNDDARAWTEGVRNDVAVPSSDPTYNNNAKYYAQQAGQSANGPLVVNYNGTTADQTFSAIKAAYDAGRVVVVFFNDTAFALSSCDASEATFANTYIDSPMFALSVLTVTSGNVWTESEVGAYYSLTRLLILYVDGTNGDDSNDGTASHPLKTISAAINTIPKSLGSFWAYVFVKAGTYTETVRIEGFSGSGGILLETSWGATISGRIVVSRNNCDIEISGFTVSQSSYSGVIDVDGCNYLNIHNVKVSNFGLALLIQNVREALVSSLTLSTGDVGIRARTGFVQVNSTKFTDVTNAIESQSDGMGFAGVVEEYYNTYTNVTNKFVGPKLVNSYIDQNVLNVIL